MLIHNWSIHLLQQKTETKTNILQVIPGVKKGNTNMTKYCLMLDGSVKLLLSKTSKSVTVTDLAPRVTAAGDVVKTKHPVCEVILISPVRAHCEQRRWISITHMQYKYGEQAKIDVELGNKMMYPRHPWYKMVYGLEMKEKEKKDASKKGN
jgi:hypothetical protein